MTRGFYIKSRQKKIKKVSWVSVFKIYSDGEKLKSQKADFRNRNGSIIVHYKYNFVSIFNQNYNECYLMISLTEE